MLAESVGAWEGIVYLALIAFMAFGLWVIVTHGETDEPRKRSADYLDDEPVWKWGPSDD